MASLAAVDSISRKAPGRNADGKLNNWWAYVTDFNRYPESNGRRK